MSDKIKVVYIGPKPIKRITVFGKKFVLPQYIAVGLDDDVAHHLLDIPTVFSTEEEAKGKIEEQKAFSEKIAAKKREAEEAAKKEAVDSTWLVYIDDEEVDISKWTSAKLKTLVVAEDLDIEAGDRSVQVLRESVRDALHAKSGNPAAEA